VAGDRPTISPAALGDIGTPPTGGSIFDAPVAAEPARQRKPIAELLSGIQLPCDLAPMVDFERPIGARDAVAFVTRDFGASEVGQAIGSELRRLGFDLTPRHATEVIAARADEWLAVAVHGDAADVERGGRSAFPGAGDTGVVVEFWTE
jgi:hypothetical protein